jgi:hypothetical protein
LDLGGILERQNRQKFLTLICKKMHRHSQQSQSDKLQAAATQSDDKLGRIPVMTERETIRLPEVTQHCYQQYLPQNASEINYEHAPETLLPLSHSSSVAKKVTEMMPSMISSQSSKVPDYIPLSTAEFILKIYRFGYRRVINTSHVNSCLFVVDILKRIHSLIH